jgi:hypothetical protein
MTRQTVEEFIAAGGTVTRCTPYERMTLDDVARIVLSAPEKPVKRERNGRRQRPSRAEQTTQPKRELQPQRERAKVAICWLCDRQLWAGGTSYTTIVEDGHEHPTHKFCAKQAQLQKSVEVQARKADHVRD